MKDGYVPLRRGIRDHLPNMSSAEVKLFCFYLTNADFRTAICDLKNSEVAEQIGWSEKNVSITRKKLIQRKFIIPNKRGETGVFITKFPKAKKEKEFVEPPEWAAVQMSHTLPKGNLTHENMVMCESSTKEDMVMCQRKKTSCVNGLSADNKKTSGRQRSRSKKLIIKRSSRSKILSSQIQKIKTLHDQFENTIGAGIGGIIGQWRNWGMTNASDNARKLGQNPVAEYLDTFRTERMVETGRRIGPSKELRLLQELQVLTEDHKAEYFMQAIQDVNRRKLRRPLKNHNYLKQVILSKEHEAKKQEPPKTTRRKGYYLE